MKKRKILNFLPFKRKRRFSSSKDWRVHEEFIFYSVINQENDTLFYISDLELPESASNL